MGDVGKASLFNFFQGIEVVSFLVGKFVLGEAQEYEP
jgi:hypothetical protein